MSTTNTTQPADTNLEAYCERLADRAAHAGRGLATVSGERRDAALLKMADLLEQRTDQLVEENRKDLDRAGELGLTDAMVDRLRLDEARVRKMAASVRQIANQTDPVGRVIEGYVRPNGLKIEKTRVPLGVVLFIYESRPNVTSDAAALCLKSGNALILRGGKEAIHSNTAIAAIIADAIEQAGLDTGAVQVVQTTDREAVSRLLRMNDRIDLVIPRGGESLIRAVAEQSHIPVIKHYTGNCHVYVDQHAAALPGGMAVDIAVNAKTQRTGVCNAAESMLFHADSGDLLEQTAKRLDEAGVRIRGCERTVQRLQNIVASDHLAPATEDDWDTEYLDLTVAIRVVDSMQDALDHIHRHGSKHTDAILTADALTADAFVAAVDSANVMVNCSTRFSDGGEYGLGAEIGISTDKLHARGPMGAADLTTYKWIVRGHGQVRS